MKISLIGVLEDGTPKREGVPINPRNTITIQQGANVTIEVKVQTPGGTFIDLGDPTTSIVLSVKKKPADQPPPIQKTATKLGSIATFTLLPADTKNMTPGRYIYDVWLTCASIRDAVIPLSTLVLEATATTAP
jgi:hypothetical protein